MGLRCWFLEDGFLRSFGTGNLFPGLSLVVDEQGAYYDSTRPSALEGVLANSQDVLAGRVAASTAARNMLLARLID